MSLFTRPDSRVSQMRLSVPVNGSRVPLLRSVGTTDTVKAAAVASSLQSLADSLPSGEWLRIRRYVEDVFLAAGHPVPVITREALPVLRLIGPFVEDYLSRRKSKVSASHFGFMERCLKAFALQHAAMELVHFKGLHIQAWLDGLEGLSVGSVRNSLSVVSAAFAYAVKLGVVSVNPCAGVDAPESEPAVLKMPMSDEDFGKLVGSVSGDWLTSIMFMRYSGLRLADSVSIRREQVSFAEGACLLEVTPGKTGNAEVIPLFSPLVEHLKGLEVASGPLSPSLCGLSPSCLSKQFVKLCEIAGVDLQPVTLPNGRVHRRVSAHSLKHAFVTWLARLGIPEALRMKLAAHVSESAHRGYNHEDGLDLHKQVAGYFKGV